MKKKQSGAAKKILESLEVCWKSFETELMELLENLEIGKEPTRKPKDKTNALLTEMPMKMSRLLSKLKTSVSDQAFNSIFHWWKKARFSSQKVSPNY